MASTLLSNRPDDCEKVNDGAIQGVAPIIAATTLTVADSNRTFIITPSVAGFTITLPAPTVPGMRFKFIQAANAAGATLITSTAANVTYRGATAGAIVTAGADVAALIVSINAQAIGQTSAACTSVSIVGNSASSIGDNVEFIATGTLYIAYGFSALRAGIALA